LGLASLMRPWVAAPDASSVSCRYALAQTLASAIVAAPCVGGLIQTSPFLELAAGVAPAHFLAFSNMEPTRTVVACSRKIALRGVTAFWLD
jgi:hypothetical protein